MAAWIPAFSHNLLIDSTIVFSTGLLFALLARRLRQSPLLGYLLAGLLIGPYGLRLIPREVTIDLLAQVGIVMLMFALGVQLSLRQLLEVRTTALFGGLAQVALTILLGMLCGWGLGLPSATGLVLGYALALSSSIVLVRLLGEADELHTPYGQLALGISVVQDLLAVIIISTLPFLAASTTSYANLIANLLKALFFVVWIVLFARLLAPAILRWASASGSRDVLLPTVVVLSLGGALLGNLLGFSLALGAFLAGLAISESVYTQAVLAEVIPLRDIFGLLFFVSLGMLVNPSAILALPGTFAVLLVAAIFGKALIIIGVLLLLRQHLYPALLAGMSIAQVGEFSFLVARDARALGIINPALHSVILAVAIVSIALTPLMLAGARAVYRRVSRREHHLPAPIDAYAQEEPQELTVLLCGYGRVGHTIAQALDTFRIPFTVIDLNRQAVERLRRRGIHAVFGDAANHHLLQRLHPAHFQLGVIALPETAAVRTIAVHLQRLHPAMRLLLRSHTDLETARYLAMGVDYVVQIEMEASLAFVRQVLAAADVDQEIVNAYLHDIRTGYYEALQPREQE